MFKSFAILFLVFTACASALAQIEITEKSFDKNIFLTKKNNLSKSKIIRVPKSKGNPVLIDGMFAAAEWQNARVIEIDSSTQLLLQQYKNHVFIGIKNSGAAALFVDLFLVDERNQIYNLHASLQIGERVLTDDLWTDNKPAWRWGNHRDWIANEAKPDSAKDNKLPFSERIFPREGVEFQIRRSRFSGKQWRVRIEVRDFEGNLEDVVFPRESERKDSTGWMIFDVS